MLLFLLLEAHSQTSAGPWSWQTSRDDQVYAFLNIARLEGNTLK
jgi:hypothetical protein